MYTFVVPFASILLLAALVCGLAGWNAQSKWGKATSVLLVLICALALPDLLLRRLPATLADPHAGEFQRLMTAAHRADLMQKYAEAERLYRIITDKEKSAWFSVDSRNSMELPLANVLVKEGKLQEAERSYRQALRHAEFDYGSSNQELVGILEGLGSVCELEKKYKESEDAYTRALSINEKTRKTDKAASEYYDDEAKRILAGYAKLLRDTGRSQQAEVLERQAK